MRFMAEPKNTSPLSLRERARVREIHQLVESPHPNPLPQGEGVIGGSFETMKGFVETAC
jgi:hypothetical protein